jgi:hypothetical protein
MANARIKGLNVTVGLVFDGVQQSGSFSKVENFELTPNAELRDSDFLGESESEPDYMHHGYDFKFSIHETDKGVMELYDVLTAASAAGTTLPRVDVVVITTFVDPAVPAATEVLQEAVIKIDSRSVGSRKDYVKYSVSGKCKAKKLL